MTEDLFAGEYPADDPSGTVALDRLLNDSARLRREMAESGRRDIEGSEEFASRTLELYDFQHAAIEGLRANIRRGVKNQILAAPTGSGKTICATYLLRECHANGKRAVFVADRIPLIDQTSAVLDTYGIPHGIIQANHWRWRPWERIQIASAQTLKRRQWPEADLIVIDEAHGVHGTVKERLKERDTIAIGLSATPFTRGLGAIYDEVVSVTTTDKLIEDGWLAPFEVYSSSEPDMKGARTTAGEWGLNVAAERSMPIIGDLVREYLKHGRDRKFICFGSTIAHAEEIQRHFLSAGIHVELYVSETDSDSRAAMVAEFRKPDSYVRGLISVAALAKGFDVEDVGVVILARPLRSSLSEHIQMIGRGLRRDPNDPDKVCTILDHAGNCARFWDETMDVFANGAPPLDDGKQKPKKKKKGDTSQARKCPTCHHVHGPRRSCPKCGYEYPRIAKVQHQEGELHALGGAGVSHDDKQDFYSELYALAELRGYKNGWVAHKYRERFGVWPRGMVDRPRPVSQATHNWVKSRQIAWAKRKKP